MQQLQTGVEAKGNAGIPAKRNQLYFKYKNQDTGVDVQRTVPIGDPDHQHGN